MMHSVLRDCTYVVEQVPVQCAWMPLMAQKSYATIKKLFSFTGSLNHSFAFRGICKEQPCCVKLSGHRAACGSYYMLVACQTTNAHCVSAK